MKTTFVRDRIGGIAHRRLDVLAGEPRVRVNEICLRGAFAQLNVPTFVIEHNDPAST